MITVNLIYFADKTGNGNFGDELSRFIIGQIINKEKYTLVTNKPNVSINLIGIGSFIHVAPNNCWIFGSGVRTENNIEKGHRYEKLNVCAVRGPLTRKFLEEKKHLKIPEVFGDPALLLPRFYKPVIDQTKHELICVLPHKSNYDKYVNIDKNKFCLTCPTDKWENVINNICSCKCVISSSLHGLICSDAYGIPNIWLDEYKLPEGDFKFRDYFQSQQRQYVKITTLNSFDMSSLYTLGNKINLDKLLKIFPFN